MHLRIASLKAPLQLLHLVISTFAILTLPLLLIPHTVLASPLEVLLPTSPTCTLSPQEFGLVPDDGARRCAYSSFVAFHQCLRIYEEVLDLGLPLSVTYNHCKAEADRGYCLCMRGYISLIPDYDA